jgi:hypothetical protein
MDGVVILFSLQCKWKWEIVRILRLGSAFGRLLSDLNSAFHSRGGRVAVAAAVKVARAEAIAAAASQQRKVLPTELSNPAKSVGKSATIREAKRAGTSRRRLNRGEGQSGGAEGRLFSAKTSAWNPSTAT